MSDYGLSVSGLYSAITDQELDSEINEKLPKLWISIDAWTFTTKFHKCVSGKP